jgi:asparagine synthase (glutamine-hydrolysing)
MSGIVGMVYLDGRPVDELQFNRSVETLAHRGPDGRAVWREGSVALGHLMLHVTPESVFERLPLQDASGNLVLTANARIDNREELISCLDIHGDVSRITDSQLILAAYQRWGQSCPEYLLGDFAFAIWDKREQTLFAARDHIGIRPFYYYAAPGRLFVFGSEIKAVLAVDEVPHVLNELMLGTFILGNMSDPVITLYRDILRLPAGHTLTVSRAGVVKRCYWLPDPTRELRLRSDAEYDEQFLGIFTKAVECRLRSAFPVGSDLSGGLDSSSIVCIARKLLSQRANPNPLNTFSAFFEDYPVADERRYINTVVAQGGLSANYVRVDHINPLADYKQWQRILDTPVWPNVGIFSALARSAQSQGVRVLLSGEEGDNIVGYGFGAMRKQVITGHWIAAYRNISGVAASHGASRWGTLKTYVLRPLMPRRLLALRDRWMDKRRDPFRVISPTFDERLPWKGLQRLASTSAVPSHRATWDEWNAVTHGATSGGCEIWDNVSSHFNLERRYPFYDRRLVEFCLALPVTQRLSGGWMRMILRRSMKGLLPEEIRWRRRKSSITPAIEGAVLRDERKTFDQIILGDPRLISPYFDLDGLRRVYSHFTEEGFCSVVGVGFWKLWGAISLALWLESADLNP